MRLSDPIIHGDEPEWWAALLAAVTLMIAAIAHTARSVRRVSRMVDIFLGYGDHPGIDERMSAVEHRLERLERLLSIHVVAATTVTLDDLDDVDTP